MKDKGEKLNKGKRLGKKKWNILRTAVTAVLVLSVLILAGVAVFAGMRASGRKRLYSQADGGQMIESMSARSEAADILEEEQGSWQEGDIRYEGTHYRYNEDILTFLFLGIDKMTEVKAAKNGKDGGQSDAIFLLALNPHTKEITVIGIPRDTMAEIDVYGDNGEYLGSGIAQITLQHGYGDGAALSCERSRKAVSKLFYDLPIHGYCAINMGAVPLINDAVGGVELEALESIDFEDFHVKEGETVHLMGMESYHYLHYRDVGVFNSAGRRLERQKQYLSAYAAAVMAAVRKDITLPVALYNTLSRYMVTDLSLDEVSYLAAQMAGYHFGEDNLYSLDGETVSGKKYEEFYIDEAALYERILQVFYEEVED